MTQHDKHSQIDSERTEIIEASRRLIEGTPQRSSGRPSITALAEESGVTRQRLYEHHADLISEFKAMAGNYRPTSSDTTAIEYQLDLARKRIQDLEANETRLRGQIRTLQAIIVELTHEAAASNVVRLPPS